MSVLETDMKQLNPNMKDWEIARIMFNKNTKKECKLIKELRKHGTVKQLCEDWYIVIDDRIEEDCGLLVPIECLINKI